MLFKLIKLGKWTMVYDEGFEVNIGDNKQKNETYMSFFVFLKYSKNRLKNSAFSSKWVSHCYQSLIGWYHIDDNKWGCFKGHKETENYGQVTNGEASDKKNITEDSIIRSFIEQANEIKKGLRSFFTAYRFTQSQWKNSYTNTNKFQARSSSKTVSEIKLTSQSKNHAEVIERINTMDLSWKAAEYEQFKDYTIGELNDFLDNKKNTRKFNFNLTRTESKAY